MDLTSVMTTLMSAESVKNLSKKTGSSQKEVTSVLTAALPLLLQGADSQAKDESTSESFAKALMQHSEDDTSDLSNFLGNVDMADGAKIIGHLLGAGTESTTKKVSNSSGTDAESTAKILAAAAPLLMSLLGQETKKSKKSSKNKTNELVGDLVTAVLDNVDVGSLLMGMLTDTEEEPETKKKTTAKKTAAKKAATKKSTTAKKKTAAKTTTKKKKAADKDEGVDLADAANLLIKLLK
ncbi:MAG: DUF937 domain-containing protein [Oscillospiraceae bacterium]|nr:DUF937 domain-containing protein [Oscillospiraceae bacterium]